MALDQKDIELIERIIYKNADDIAVSIARSFERLEERFDAAESRTYSRLSEIEEQMTTSIQGVSDSLTDIREEIRVDTDD